ncbi:MAG: carboxypeptidase-like regulatory domain-containing protein [Bacteroidetes bacterium]|nr:carboxypeptidase-like regulatory domain-containing protein [Bacteroidota bacterium]
MPNDIHLSINNPCSEYWGQMSPQNEGRHCSSCNKVVIDFTVMSDQEVLDWLSRQQGPAQGPAQRPTCGRLRQGQLNRPLIAAQQRKPSRWNYWRFLIAGILFCSEVSAQGHAKAPEILHSRVVDSKGEPVPYASVSIDANHITACDSNGQFSIKSAGIGQILTISAIGYQTLRVDADKLKTQVALQMQETMMGDIVIVRRPKKSKPILDIIKDSLSDAGFTVKTLKVHPNPVPKGNSIMLSMKFDQPGAYRAELYSLAGQLEETMEINGGLSSTMMNIPATLAPGTYVVRVSHPSVKKVYTQQVVVL